MKAPPDRPKPKFFDLAVPFFLPVWRRVLTAVVPILWAMVELANGEPFWAMIFFALGVTAIWKFYKADWAEVAAQAEEDAKRGG